MRSTSPRHFNEPGHRSSSDVSNTNATSLSLGACRNDKGPTHFDQGSLPPSFMTSSQTPAPSPRPVTNVYHQHHQLQGTPFPPFAMMNTQHPDMRLRFLSSIISSCTLPELLFISQASGILLKCDFLYSLPPELSFYILTFIDEPQTITRASQVSKHWRAIMQDENIWKRMCYIHGFDNWDLGEMLNKQLRKKRLGVKSKTVPDRDNSMEENTNDIDDKNQSQLLEGDPTSERRSKRRTEHSRDFPFSYRRHFKTSYTIHTNWRKGGTLLCSHRLPIISPHNGTVTSLALDSDWVVVGFADSKIQVFSARTGVLTRTLVGHHSGVWGLCLVSSGGYRLVDANKSGTKKKTRTTSSGKAKIFDAASLKEHKEYPRPSTKEASSSQPSTPTQVDGAVAASSKKHKKSSKPSTKDAGASSLQPSIHTLRAGVAGIGLHPDSRDEMHVMPSKSLEFLVSPAMKIALGLEALTDNEHDDSEGDSHREDEHLGSEAKARSILHEDSPKRRNHARTGGTTSSKEEELPDIGVGQGNPDKPSNMCYASQGWGQPNSLIVSGGCDKVVRVWDVESGYCIYVLHGHTSTIRSLRVLHNRPIAVTGSRDTTLRVWDIQRGECLHVLEGHHESVRCLDVCGNRVVSGSYDNTCRLWDVDTGECIFVLEGHLYQIYCVAFDGVRIASGGLDSTVRVWDAETGECLALLQGHTSLVCQLQLSPTILATGGSDGQVIIFSLDTYMPLRSITAHDSPVISLQFDKDFLVTAGNDGRVRLFETRTGKYVRELNGPGESVWKAAFLNYTYVITSKRAEKTVVEIWSLLGSRKGRRKQWYE